MPLEEVADKGGMAIQNHFVTGGQAVSVYDADDIAEKILAQVMPEPGESESARRQQTLEDARRQKEVAAALLHAQKAAAEDEQLAMMEVSHGLQLQSLWRTSTAAVS